MSSEWKQLLEGMKKVTSEGKKFFIFSNQEQWLKFNRLHKKEFHGRRLNHRELKSLKDVWKLMKEEENLILAAHKTPNGLDTIGLSKEKIQ